VRVILEDRGGDPSWERTFLRVSSDSVVMVDGRSGWIVGPIIFESAFSIDVHYLHLSILLTWIPPRMAGV
jgi:hypothetical protein